MNIAALRVPLTFQRNETYTDEYGNHLSEWTDFFTCYATAGTGSGSETGGAVTREDESVDFTCRWCPELAAVTSKRFRIIAEGKIYNITYVNHMGFKHVSIKFNCRQEKNDDEREQSVYR